MPPDCPIPAEQYEPDLARVTYDKLTQTVTMPKTVYNAYEIESLALTARVAALLRCYAAIGGTVISLPGTTPALPGGP